MMSGFSGSMTGSKPSPPSVTYQSEFRIPALSAVCEGPPSVLLSCVPPYT